ncbi:uncharacterized protein LOC101781231, partial [Setaria italica]|uniref:uncharacterized protein LOC101781231 n=1 Tax=Setaria italica TaxID=4555 RepID=UPI000350B705
MTPPDTPPDGTFLVIGALADSEIQQRLREALEDKDVGYPVPGHPPMRPEPGFVDLGSLTRVKDSLPPVPEDAARRALNRVQAEKDNASPRGVSLRLAPKKMLRSSSSSGGRDAAPPAATGGVPGVAAGLPAEVAAEGPVVGTAAGSAARGGADPTPPAAPPDAETAVGGADAPADVARSEAEGALVPEGAAVVEVPVPEGEVPAPAAPTGVLPAAEGDVPTEVPSAAAVATGVQAPESSVVHGGVARAQAALTSALGALADTVVPGNQALQEASLEKSNFLRRQRKLWEHYIAKRERSRGLALQLGAAQGAAAMEKARHDAEGLRAAATEQARRDAEELARLRGENAAFRAERDQFRLQVDGLQTAVSLSVAREHELKAKADGEALSAS